MKEAPNIIFRVWELKNMARMAMPLPDASPSVQHDTHRAKRNSVLMCLSAEKPIFEKQTQFEKTKPIYLVLRIE